MSLYTVFRVGNMELQKKVLSLGKDVGDIMEALPISKRGSVIREIQILEHSHGRSLQNKLSLHLLRIEHYKMIPSFYDDPIRREKYVPKSYGDAMVAYLASVPLAFRVEALKKIVDILNFFSNK